MSLLKVIKVMKSITNIVYLFMMNVIGRNLGLHKKIFKKHLKIIISLALQEHRFSQKIR